MKSTTATATISAINMTLGCPKGSYIMIKILKSTNGCLDQCCCSIWYTQGHRPTYTHSFRSTLSSNSWTFSVSWLYLGTGLCIWNSYLIKEKKIAWEGFVRLCVLQLKTKEFTEQSNSWINLPLNPLKDTVVCPLTLITFSSLNLVLLPPQWDI